MNNSSGLNQKAPFLKTKSFMNPILEAGGSDIEKVWDTAQDDLPVLKQQVIGILKDFGQEF